MHIVMKQNLKHLSQCLLKRILDAGHKDCDIELNRKIKMINVIISVGVLNLILLGIVAYFANNITLYTIEYGLHNFDYYQI